MCKGHERCNCHIPIGGPYPDDGKDECKQAQCVFQDQSIDFKSIFDSFHNIALPNVETTVQRIGYSDDELLEKANELRQRLFECDNYTQCIHQFLREMWSNVQHSSK